MTTILREVINFKAGIGDSVMGISGYALASTIFTGVSPVAGGLFCISSSVANRTISVLVRTLLEQVEISNETYKKYKMPLNFCCKVASFGLSFLITLKVTLIALPILQTLMLVGCASLCPKFIEELIEDDGISYSNEKEREKEAEALRAMGARDWRPPANYGAPSGLAPQYEYSSENFHESSSSTQPTSSRAGNSALSVALNDNDREYRRYPITGASTDSEDPSDDTQDSSSQSYGMQQNSHSVNYTPSSSSVYGQNFNTATSSTAMQKLGTLPTPS